MKSNFLKTSAIAISTLGLNLVSPLFLGSVKAQVPQFGAESINPDSIVLVAAPGGGWLGGPQLLLIEQLQAEPPCWSVSGEMPGQIEPLLLEFDFSGICNRGIDSNGYSLRTADGDIGRHFNLEVRLQDEILVLYGVPNRFPSNPYQGALPFAVARTTGLSENGYTQLELDEGWYLTKRTYRDRVLGHVYLTTDAALETFLERPLEEEAEEDEEVGGAEGAEGGE